jgi:hypothetical protein
VFCSRVAPRASTGVLCFALALCCFACAAEDPAGPGDFSTSEIAGYRDALSAPAAPTLALHDFSSAEQCGSCHPQHYDEWRGSAHAASMADPVFRALLQRQRADLGDEQDRFCTQCHSAIGTRSGDIQPGFDFAELSPLSAQGVTCEGCHRVDALERPYNSGHHLDASAPLAGPFGDAHAPHPTVRSELLGSSAFCGGCHDVRAGNGLAFESPLAEWQASPAARTGKTCQSCHMPSYRGRAANLANVPDREGLHRHWFAGVDVPLALESAADAQRDEALRRSLALLQSALGMDVSALRTGRELWLNVKIENRIDGHDFPTGSAFYRQFWLALEVYDARGVTLYQSGALDEHGDLYDRLHPDGERVDPELVRFGSYLHDASDALTELPWRARSLEKHVLRPLESETLRRNVTLPDDVQLPLRVRARLRFRAFSPRLLRSLALAALVPGLHAVDLVELTRTVE